LVLKWKDDSFGLIKEMIKKWNQGYTSPRRCGMLEEKKLPYLFKDYSEDG